MKEKKDEQKKETLRDILDSPEMEKVAELYAKAMHQYERDANSFWEGMSEEDQEKAFYIVCKRIYNGDVVKGGSYRYVLYDIFGFDPGMYGIGMDCGYMDIHNMIGKGLTLDKMLAAKNINVKCFDIEKSYKKVKDVRLTLKEKNGTAYIEVNQEKKDR